MITEDEILSILNDTAGNGNGIFRTDFLKVTYKIIAKEKEFNRELEQSMIRLSKNDYEDIKLGIQVSQMIAPKNTQIETLLTNLTKRLS